MNWPLALLLAGLALSGLLGVWLYCRLVVACDRAFINYVYDDPTAYDGIA